MTWLVAICQFFPTVTLYKCFPGRLHFQYTWLLWQIWFQDITDNEVTRSEEPLFACKFNKATYLGKRTDAALMEIILETLNSISEGASVEQNDELQDGAISFIRPEKRLSYESYDFHFITRFFFRVKGNPLFRC